MDKSELIKEFIKLKEIGEANMQMYKFIDEQLNKLNIVLLNLKIEGAKIIEPNGITPVANELKRINDTMKDRITRYYSYEKEIKDAFLSLEEMLRQL